MLIIVVPGTSDYILTTRTKITIKAFIFTRFIICTSTSLLKNNIVKLVTTSTPGDLRIYCLRKDAMKVIV